MIYIPVYGGDITTSLGTKSITANGTYNASSDSADGYSSVTVNVPAVTPVSAMAGNITSLENGINWSERSISSNRATLKGTEYSAGFEGFNVAFTGLTANKSYVCVFSWETKSGQYFSGQWMYGYKISPSSVSNYSVQYNASGWYPMVRDLNKHSYAISFTPTGTTSYLVFSLPGYSDDVDNVFEVTDLMVIDPATL